MRPPLLALFSILFLGPGLLAKEIILIYTADAVSDVRDIPWAFSQPDYWDACIIPEEIELRKRVEMLAEVSTAVSIEIIQDLKLGDSHLDSFKLYVEEGSLLAELDLDKILSAPVEERLRDYQRKDFESATEFLEEEIARLRKFIARDGLTEDIDAAKQALSRLETIMNDKDRVVMQQDWWTPFLNFTTLSNFSKTSE